MDEADGFAGEERAEDDAPRRRRRSSRSNGRSSGGEAKPASWLWRLSLLAVALALAWPTYVVHFETERYESAGPGWLPAGWAADAAAGASGWEASGGGGVTAESGRLVVEGERGRTAGAALTLDVPPGTDAVRLSAEVALQNVGMGEQPWERARLFLVGLKPDGSADWRRTNKLLQSSGTMPLTLIERDFPLDPYKDRALLGVRLAKVAGRVEVASLEVTPLKLLPEWRDQARVLAAGWATLALLVAWRMLRRARRKWAAAALLALTGVGLAAALLPHGVRNPLVGALGLSTDDLGPYHVGAAALLALLWRLAYPRQRLLAALALIAAASLAFEGLQVFEAGLGGDDWDDALLNLAGGVAGLALATLWRKATREHARNRSGRDDPVAARRHRSRRARDGRARAAGLRG